MMKFKITEFVKDYIEVDGKHQWVTCEKDYEATTWDDLTNLIATIIDFSSKPVKFEIRKEAK